MMLGIFIVSLWLLVALIIIPLLFTALVFLGEIKDRNRWKNK